jgi:plasmid stabilization system protein ParE
MRIRFLGTAAEDLDRIYAGKSPANARLISDRIWQRLFALEQFPEMGRLGRVRGSREIVVDGYIVAYLVDWQRSEILIISAESGASRR